MHVVADALGVVSNVFIDAPLHTDVRHVFMRDGVVDARTPDGDVRINAVTVHIVEVAHTHTTDPLPWHIPSFNR